jgi:Holliday junction DNA helicase RuvA
LASVIGQLTGIAVDKSLDGNCVLDVHGVGYEVTVPLRSLASLPSPPELVTLHVHTYVREDTLRLYGFPQVHDRAAFRVMLGVSGVGPKLAMAILSDMTAAEISSAVARADKKRLAGVSGIGKKMAERLVLELKDKLPTLSSTAVAGAFGAPSVSVQGRAGEVAAALTALGFSRAQAEAAAAKVVLADDVRPLEGLVRQALATLA